MELQINICAGCLKPLNCRLIDMVITYRENREENKLDELGWHKACYEQSLTPAPDAALVEALRRIDTLSSEWNANKMGTVEWQRKRWQRLGEIARAALASVEQAN